MESNLKKYTIVYLTINTKNNKIYVGIHDTLNPYKFCGYLGCGVNRNYPSSIKHPTTPFMYAVKKYGFDSFRRVTLAIFNDREDAKRMEREIVNEEFIKRDDTYNIALGGGDPPRSDIPVYQYDLNGNFKACYPSYHLAAVQNNGKCGATIKIAVDNKCCAFESFWSLEYCSNLDVSKYKNTLQKIKVYLYKQDGTFYKEFESQSAAVREIGTTLHQLQRAIATETKVRGYFVSVDFVEKFIKTKNPKKNIKVYQYDLEGNYIGEFDSCNKVVVKYGNSYLRLPTILKSGNNKCGDFLWSTEKLPSMTKFEQKNKKIGRYNHDGELLEVFDKVRDARKVYGNVSRVLSGKASHCKGFVFKYI